MNTHPYFADRNGADHRNSLQAVADNARRAKQSVEPASPKPKRTRRLGLGLVRRPIRVRPAETN
jgi:hypothetical protein